MLLNVLLVIYLVASLGVIGLVLIQQGKGADMGASFGAGASNTVFGSGGSGNFLTRSTAVLATVFFIISLVLGHMSTVKHDSQWVAPSAGIEQSVDATDTKAATKTDTVKKVNTDEVPAAPVQSEPETSK
ncbi:MULTISPECIES: preprotein translocase subunit SecG [Vibrio]|uniref:Protein-export membrane protein SecG n=1 Tax=Vibrio algicola TaxID=2662262 RepID=A0A5Q0TEV6_9VIBR|nr:MULTISPECIES: preprotein translocase subunit SecG [Vibrio]MBD1576099.1 preprotein translocase subunit SecG [Vibrio sp. S11_S32]